MCGFGCGSADVGETAAAKRLFKEEEEEEEEVSTVVDNEMENEAEVKRDVDCECGLDGTSDGGDDNQGDKFSTSTWAGRRLVLDWNQFLSGCEREGVAKF
jgi:hypothetical protein